MHTDAGGGEMIASHPDKYRPARIRVCVVRRSIFVSRNKRKSLLDEAATNVKSVTLYSFSDKDELSHCELS